MAGTSPAMTVKVTRKANRFFVRSNTAISVAVLNPTGIVSLRSQ
jgi:hypothetical protein